MSKEGISLSHSLKDAGCLGSKLVATPHGLMLLVPDVGDLVDDLEMYRRLAGRFIYLTITRPNIAYVNVVSQFMNSYGCRNTHLEVS